MNAVNTGLSGLIAYMFSERAYREAFNTCSDRFDLMPSIKTTTWTGLAIVIFFVLLGAGAIYDGTPLHYLLFSIPLIVFVFFAFCAALLFIHYSTNSLTLISFYFLVFCSTSYVIIHFINDPSYISSGGVFYYGYLLLASVMFLPFLPLLLVGAVGTIRLDKDRQAHLLFLLSMAALGWALWLQNGGHWQKMAVLDSPIVLPLVNWKIPFTDSIGFLFALLGFVHDPVAGSLSVAVQAHINEIVLFMGAGLLFLFAEIRLHKSAVGVQPRFALLAFVLFWLAVFVEVALHWSSAPVFHPALILFNRALAVLAFGVYLFWRRVAKYGEPVRGADGVFKAACDWAELEGWKIAAWLLGVLWLSTQLSHTWLDDFPEAIQYILCIVLLGVPLRKIIGFKHEFDSLLAPYRNALQLERESYQPPPVVATEKETRDALGDDDDKGG